MNNGTYLTSCDKVFFRFCKNLDRSVVSCVLGSSSIWTCRISNICCCFLQACTLEKSKQIFDILNSKFVTSKSMSYQEHYCLKLVLSFLKIIFCPLFCTIQWVSSDIHRNSAKPVNKHGFDWINLFSFWDNFLVFSLLVA